MHRRSADRPESDTRLIAGLRRADTTDRDQSSRPRLAVQWLALTTLLSALAALAWFATSPTAGADEVTNASLSLAVSPDDAGAEFRTVAMSVEPGSTGLAALTAAFHYDSELIEIARCSVSEAGACNDVGGSVRVAVFNLGGLAKNDQLMTVDFVIRPGATGTATFELSIEEALDFDADTVPEIAATALDVDLGTAAEPADGSLTGDVIDAASTAGLFGIEVCALTEGATKPACATTNGWGAWRIDELTSGTFEVTFTDPNGVYEGQTSTATVSSPEISTGIDAELVLIDAATEPESDVPADSVDVVDDPAELDPPAPPVADSAPPEIAGEASVSGTILERSTREPVFAAQVCATQPLSLYQVCGPADRNGDFVITGLRTGNYRITVVDPLGRFEDSASKLVGLVGTEHRTNITMWLTRN